MIKTKVKKVFDVKKLPSYLIVFICFGCSAIISIFALKTQGATTFSMFIFGLMGFGSELVKFHFPATAITGKNLHMGIRICFMFIGISAIVFSVAFTFAFSKNESNTLKNEFIANSDEVKTKKESKETKTKLVARLESELVKLKAEKITDLAKIHPVKFRSQRADSRDAFDIKINAKSKELTKQQSTSSLIPDKNKKVTEKKVTEKNINVGVTNLFKTVEGENNFFKCFALMMEISGIFALVDLKKRNIKVLKQYTQYEDNEQEQEQNYNNNVIDINNKNHSPVNALKSVIDKDTDNSTILDDSNNLNYGKHSFISDNGQSQSQTNIQRKTIKGFVFEKPEIEAKIKQVEAEKLDIKLNSNNNINVKFARMYVRAVIDNPQKITNQCIGLTSMAKIAGHDREELRKGKNFLEALGILLVVDKIKTIILDHDRFRSYL